MRLRKSSDRALPGFAGQAPYKNRQANFVSVCTTDPSHVIGVMGAIVYDPSELLTHSSDAGSLMMFSLFLPKCGRPSMPSGPTSSPRQRYWQPQRSERSI
jgi:hypothetical protein